MRRLYEILPLVLCAVAVAVSEGVRTGAAGLAAGLAAALTTPSLAPGAGDEVLPPAARGVARIARARRLADFRLSAALAGDALTVQRATEGAWPAAVNSASAMLFLAAGEGLPPSCREAERSAEVVLAVCD